MATVGKKAGSLSVAEYSTWVQWKSLQERDEHCPVRRKHFLGKLLLEHAAELGERHVQQAPSAARTSWRLLRGADIICPWVWKEGLLFRESGRKWVTFISIQRATGMKPKRENRICSAETWCPMFQRYRFSTNSKFSLVKKAFSWAALQWIPVLWSKTG